MSINDLFWKRTRRETGVPHPSRWVPEHGANGGLWPQRVAIYLILLIVISVGFSACANPFYSATNQKTNVGSIAIAANSPLSTPLRCPQSQDNKTQKSFVEKDGTHFVYQHVPLRFYGYTFYRGPSHWQNPNFTQEIDATLIMGAQARQNLARPTDFWDKDTPGQQVGDTTIWSNMDYLVCNAKQRGIFVVMDVSAFRWLLMSKGRDPYDASNWKDFLDKLGTHYSDQSSIAFYSIFGEPSPPKTIADTQHLVDFYRAVTDELSQADKNHHLITAGGFNHMEDETPQTPWWHEIYALPHNDIIAFKTYSQKDLDLIPTISAFAQKLKKPIVDEEFGLPQSMGDAATTGETYNGIFTSRAHFFENVYTLGEGNGVSGFVFWDMGDELSQGSYQVSPKTPAVWHVIQEHAKRK